MVLATHLYTYTVYHSKADLVYDIKCVCEFSTSHATHAIDIDLQRLCWYGSHRVLIPLLPESDWLSLAAGPVGAH